MVDLIKGCAEINLHYPSLLPTLQCTLQCMGHTEVHHKYSVLSDMQIGFKVGSTSLRSINSPRLTDTMHAEAQTPYITPYITLMLWKSVGNWQQMRTVCLWQLG